MLTSPHKSRHSSAPDHPVGFAAFEDGIVWLCLLWPDEEYV